MTRSSQNGRSAGGVMTFAPCFAAVLLMALSACGGGGSNNTPATSQSSGSTSTTSPTTPSPPAQAVTGTAAKGSPLAGVTITLHDSLGASATGVTSSNGTFSITTTGMTPPYILQVPEGSSYLYSVSADSNLSTTINLTPITDVIIRSWYQAQGISIDTAFSAITSHPAPTPTVVALLSQPVQGAFRLWLDQASVASSFNLISSSFTADGTGLDQVLDETSITGNTITITNGTATQTSTVAASAGSLTITTSTTAATAMSGDITTTLVPIDSAQLNALTGVVTSLTSLASAINGAGSSLTASTLTPFLDPNLLNDGLDEAQFASQLASSLQGTSVALTVASLESLNSAGTQAKVKLNLIQTKDGQSQDQSDELYLTNISGTWVLSGDQRIANLDLTSEVLTSQGATTSPNGPVVNVGVKAPTGTVTAVTLTGGGIFTAATLAPGSEDVGSVPALDTFYTQSALLTSLPTPGTAFTFTLTPATGPAVSYTVKSNGVTNESVGFTGFTSTALSAANLGGSLPIAWTLPVTYAVDQVQVTALTFTGSQSSSSTDQCETQASGVGISSTTTTLNIPATCNGQPVTSVNLNLSVIGKHQEQSQAIYVFGTP